MPQLDLFTLLLHSKSFSIFFLSLYFLLVFLIVPRVHFVISLRRLQVLKLLRYYNFLKLSVFQCFSSQCSILELYFKEFNFLFNSIFNLYFQKFVDSKYSISTFLFSNIHW